MRFEVGKINKDNEINSADFCAYVSNRPIETNQKGLNLLHTYSNNVYVWISIIRKENICFYSIISVLESTNLTVWGVTAQKHTLRSTLF